MSHRAAQKNATTTTTAAKALSEIRRITLETLGDHVTTVYLFGSWARHSATHSSDVDVAVDSPTPLPRGLLAQLRERLEESHVPYRVDVVDLREADPGFRQRVLQESVVWSD